MWIVTSTSNMVKIFVNFSVGVFLFFSLVVYYYMYEGFFLIVSEKCISSWAAI